MRKTTARAKKAKTRGRAVKTKGATRKVAAKRKPARKAPAPRRRAQPKVSGIDATIVDDRILNPIYVGLDTYPALVAEDVWVSAATQHAEMFGVEITMRTFLHCLTTAFPRTKPAVSDPDPGSHDDEQDPDVEDEEPEGIEPDRALAEPEEVDLVLRGAS